MEVKESLERWHGHTVKVRNIHQDRHIIEAFVTHPDGSRMNTCGCPSHQKTKRRKWEGRLSCLIWDHDVDLGLTLTYT